MRLGWEMEVTLFHKNKNLITLKTNVFATHDFCHAEKDRTPKEFWFFF